MGNTAATKKSGGSMDLDPRSPSSRTPVGKLVKERKASVVEFSLDSPSKPSDAAKPDAPGTPEPADPLAYDPRSPSSRTPVAVLVRERKMSAAQPVHFDDDNDDEDENCGNVVAAAAPAAKKPVDLQKAAVKNAQRQANEAAAAFPLR